jgi:hypothetical protein
MYNLKSKNMEDFNARPLVLKTERKEAEVVTGAILTLSLADARGILAMTQYPAPSAEEEHPDYLHHRVVDVNQKSRDFLRFIAKRILLSEGKTTEVEMLFDKFADPNTDAPSY